MPAILSAAISGDRDAQAKTLAGLICAFRFQPNGSPEELNVDGPITDGGGWLWLHFNLADMRACHFLTSASHLPAPARALLVSADEHQQLHGDETCVYGLLTDLVCGLDGVIEEIDFLHFAVTETMFVSARRHTLTAIEATRRVLRGGLKVTTLAVLLQAITQQMVEAVDHYAEDLANRLDWIEEQILADEVSFDGQNIGRVRRMSVRLHRQLVILRSLIHRFEHDIERSSMSGVRLPTEKLIQPRLARHGDG